MNSDPILRQLDLTEVNIGQGEQQIKRQRDVIEDLERHGQDGTAARALLSTYEKRQAHHMQERRRFLSELAGGIPPPGA